VSESNSENMKLDAMVVVRMPLPLKNKVTARARLKNRTTSQWVRMVIEKVLSEVAPTPAN
jgi:predicted DNA-binding protein